MQAALGRSRLTCLWLQAPLDRVQNPKSRGPRPGVSMLVDSRARHGQACHEEVGHGARSRKALRPSRVLPVPLAGCHARRRSHATRRALSTRQARARGAGLVLRPEENPRRAEREGQGATARRAVAAVEARRGGGGLGRSLRSPRRCRCPSPLPWRADARGLQGARAELVRAELGAAQSKQAHNLPEEPLGSVLPHHAQARGSDAESLEPQPAAPNLLPLLSAGVRCSRRPTLLPSSLRASRRSISPSLLSTALLLRCFCVSLSPSPARRWPNLHNPARLFSHRSRPCTPFTRGGRRGLGGCRETGDQDDGAQQRHAHFRVLVLLAGRAGLCDAAGVDMAVVRARTAVLILCEPRRPSRPGSA
mmetsp:Transcript_59462/g.140037  ORF Transcript_59462/g.140037 Transcript_59462/m.140037 type:complete len:363 (+) Transcript_59462:2004-3092(+)